MQETGAPVNRGGFRRVLVTGGAGFIGSNLVRRLLERGDEVRVFDNFSTGRWANLAELESEIEVFEGDLRCPEEIQAATRGVELVFHLGALPSIPRSMRDPGTTRDVNVAGTRNALVEARDAGVRRVVLASSSSVYGDSGPLPRTEAAKPAPVSPYAESKLAAEAEAVEFSRRYRLETVVLRYFNVFGPNQDPASQHVVPSFVSAIASGTPVRIHGDGEQSRDLTYVADVVEANILASDAPGVDGVVLNVAAGRSETINSLAATIGAILDRPVARRYLPARPGDVRHSWGDIGLARRLLGYEPRIRREDGLRLAARGVLAAGSMAATASGAPSRATRR